MMKGLSLFSGIGGFDIAMEKSGIELVGMCEIDKNAQTVLKKHFPTVPLYNDVKEIGENTHDKGSIDIICGGFPCQDLSIAGKRAGLAGERSGLWYEFARIIRELEPKWVLIENVAGLLSSNKGADFAVILRWLVEHGYGVSWRVLDSQHFGVPQRRRRVFVVASLGNGCAAEILFEPESLPRDIKKGGEKGQEASGTFTIRSGKDGGGKGYLGSPEKAMTLGGQQQWAYSIREDATKNNFSATPLDVANALSALQPSTQSHHAQTFIVQDNVAHTLRANAKQSLMSGDGVINETIVYTMAHGQSHAEIIEDGAPTLNTNHEQPIVWEMNHAAEVYRDAGEISPTLQARMGTGGNNVPLVGVRRLTPTECERLQGFPDGWTEDQADSQRYKQLGNAVTVPVVQWIVGRIADFKKYDKIFLPTKLIDLDWGGETDEAQDLRIL